MHKDRQMGNVDFSLNEGYFIVRKRKDGVNRKNMANTQIYMRRVLLIIMILTVSFLIIYQSTDGYIGNLVARKDNRVLPLEQSVAYNRTSAKSGLQKYKTGPFWIQDTVNVTTPGDVSLKAHQSRYTGNLEAKGDIRMLSVEKSTPYNRTTAKRGTQRYKQDRDDMQNVTTDLKVNSNSKSVALDHDTNELPRSEKRQTSVDIKQDNSIPLYIQTFIHNRTVVGLKYGLKQGEGKLVDIQGMSENKPLVNLTQPEHITGYRNTTISKEGGYLSDLQHNKTTKSGVHKDSPTTLNTDTPNAADAGPRNLTQESRIRKHPVSPGEMYNLTRHGLSEREPKPFQAPRTAGNEVQYSNLTAPSLKNLDKEIPLKRQNYSLPSYSAHLTIGRGSYFKIPVPHSNHFLYIASAYLDTRFNRRIVRIFGMRRWNQTVKVRCSCNGEMATPGPRESY